MAKKIWHVPKRASVHQTVVLVELVSKPRFNNKTYSTGVQESIASKLGMAGATKSGRAITHQATRTLLALPQYLGFIFIDDSSTPSRIFVTPVGIDLINFHNIADIPHQRNLKGYRDSGYLINTSPLFLQQMVKLIITNPVIKEDCEEILVFPFRFTIRLLLELGYLDREEIGYILFYSRTEDSYELTKQRILNFRSLRPEQRHSEIEAYKSTPNGQLTLVLASSAGYYEKICYSTGLCRQIRVRVNKPGNPLLPAIRISNIDEAKKILDETENYEIFDFGNNKSLWFEYYGSSARKTPPIPVSIKTNIEIDTLILVENSLGNVIERNLINQETPLQNLPVFIDEPYRVKIFSLDNGNLLFNDELVFNYTHREECIELEINQPIIRLSLQAISNMISEMFSGQFQGFDEEYFKRLLVLSSVLRRNFIDNYRKGGRLEYLFYRLLRNLKEEGKIDEVFWYGNIGEFGLANPAPGGREGNPDIIFYIDNYLFILELTTIPGTRAQWTSSEASSVPDHIIRIKSNHVDQIVHGIFSAPSISPQLENNLRLNANEQNVGMICITCAELSHLFTNCDRNSLVEFLLERINTQLQQ